MGSESEYLLNHLHGYFGWHVRCYRQKELVVDLSPINLNFDPCEHQLENFFSVENECTIYLVGNTSTYLLFNVKKDDTKIIIGPISDIRMSKKDAYNDLIKSGFSNEMARENADAYHEYRCSGRCSQHIKNHQLALCLNYAFNGTMLELFEIVNIPKILDINANEKIFDYSTEDAELSHGTYDYEQELYSYIENGDVEGLLTMSNRRTFVGNVGKLAEDNLRNTKNLCHAAITLGSRAAMRGGASTELAYTMSDQFIRQIEEVTNVASVYYIMNNGLAEFAQIVANAKRRGITSRFAADIHQYILENVDRKLTTEDIAEHFKMNRTSICKKFKQLTGKNLASFVAEIKLDEAKRLLVGTDYPLVSIAAYLAFSSQSHFQNTFKKTIGMTPSEYRKKHRK